MTSSGVLPRYSTIDVKADTRLLWRSMTPFGMPVDPDVYISAARSRSMVRLGGGSAEMEVSAQTVSSATMGRAPTVNGWRAWPAMTTRLTDVSVEQIASSGSSRGKSDTRQATSAWLSRRTTLSGLVVGLMGIKAQPALSAAKIAITASARLSR